MILGFWLAEESHLAKDKQISLLQLDGKVRGRSSKKHPWSTDKKKSQNRLEIGERVGGN